tara:strand:- start:97 stop:411 length:315 start_codon:yes stop_codon:yes gene_type:complete
MAIRFQVCKTVDDTADTTAMANQLFAECEAQSPSKHAVFILKEGDMRDEYTALQTAATYAVRLPYVADRIYVSITSPAKSSRKRNADGATYVVFAAVAYDYHAS